MQEPNAGRTSTPGEPLAVGGSLAEAFVVRLWERPERPDGAREALRGIVRHVRSGRSATFVDETGLLAFLDAERRAPEGSSGGAP